MPFVELNLRRHKGKYCNQSLIVMLAAEIDQAMPFVNFLGDGINFQLSFGIQSGV